jgi:hypothetical protein
MLEHCPQRISNWPPKFDGNPFFQPWGQLQDHIVQHLFISNLGQIEKLFSMSALTPSVNLLGLISTCALIGMLDLG